MYWSKRSSSLEHSVNIMLLICIQSLTTSNACGVGNHDEHFYVRFLNSALKFIVES